MELDFSANSFKFMTSKTKKDILCLLFESELLCGLVSGDLLLNLPLHWCSLLVKRAGGGDKCTF